MTSIQLETCDLFGEDIELEKKRAEEASRFELGWEEVKSGLLKILTGHLLTLGTIALFVGVTIWALIPEDPQAKQKTSKLTKELFVELALGGVLIAAVISYGWIVVGHWRCLLYAPERHFTRWFIFTCFVALLITPVLNRVAVFLGSPPPLPRVVNGPQAPDDVREWRQVMLDQQEEFRENMASVRGAMQLVSFFSGVACFGCFVLFLRGIARCFDDTVSTVFANIYLVVWLIVVIQTAFVFFMPPKEVLPLTFLLLEICAGWVLLFFGYLFLVANTCWCITAGLKRERAKRKALMAGL